MLAMPRSAPMKSATCSVGFSGTSTTTARKKLVPRWMSFTCPRKSWKRSEKWTKDGGQYVEGAHRWLQRQPWDEEAPDKGEREKTSEEIKDELEALIGRKDDTQ